MSKIKQKSYQNYQPTERGFFAFNHERAGDFLLFVEAQKDCYKFLYLPGATEFYLTFEDYTESIKRGVLEFVDQLPEDVFQESLELSKRK
jgi:hypothetical protein